MLFTFKISQKGKKIIRVRFKINFKLDFEGKEEFGMTRSKSKLKGTQEQKQQVWQKGRPNTYCILHRSQVTIWPMSTTYPSTVEVLLRLSLSHLSKFHQYEVVSKGLSIYKSCRLYFNTYPESGAFNHIYHQQSHQTHKHVSPGPFFLFGLTVLTFAFLQFLLPQEDRVIFP